MNIQEDLVADVDIDLGVEGDKIMSKQPHYPGESEEFPEYDSEVETPSEPRFKAEEPILLYIKTGIGTYTVVDQPFDSRVAARQFAEEKFPGTKHKVLTQSEAVAEGEKQQKRIDKIQQSKEKALLKAKQTARAGLESSVDVARSVGMTRPQMEPRIRQAWRAPPQQPYQQSPGINIQIGTQQQQPQPEPTPDYSPEPTEAPHRHHRPERPYRPPQTFKVRPGMQMRTPYRAPRLAIPPGGGVFKPPRRAPTPEERRLRIPKGASVYDKPARVPTESPFKRRQFDFSGLHMITPRGIKSTARRQRDDIEEVKDKSKRR